ncbi:iron-siderophore ABC transporter substrate-binding protein [Agrobacterium sp.]|uniref:iron-siderophore ABC transporter substrate-binding protein n=1 Tax=Agrobacterium sp. TaxID=361 RepID=UPI0028AAA608|nr:iron-siderophore ABC transporter substrate-binding protein [Agrobacterium sp.]
MTVHNKFTLSGLGRRQVLGLLAAPLFERLAQAETFPHRIAAIDWAMLETAMALGITPIAATELIQFRKDSVEPLVPNNVADLGLRGSPNFELLYLLKPDLILISPFYTRYQQQLDAIAPTMSLPFYVKGEPPFAKALAAVPALGERLGRNAQATDVLRTVEQSLPVMRGQLSAYANRPSYVINIGDSRHFRAFGSDSMFGDILMRLGLPNAWREGSRFTFAAPVPLETLAENPDARIVVVSDVPVEARSGLRRSLIWNALEPVKNKRLVMLDNINPYGGVTAGMRFARLLAEALLANEDAL